MILTFSMLCIFVCWWWSQHCVCYLSLQCLLGVILSSLAISNDINFVIILAAIIIRPIISGYDLSSICLLFRLPSLYFLFRLHTLLIPLIPSLLFFFISSLFFHAFPVYDVLHFQFAYNKHFGNSEYRDISTCTRLNSN